MIFYNLFKKKTAFITLPNGVEFDILNPDPELIKIEHIAMSLGNQCRFTGLVDEFYSIAEHSINVAKCLELCGNDRSIVLAGLLHDAAEFVCSDLNTPLKTYIGRRYKDVEHNVEKAICKKFGVDLFLNKVIIKRFDKYMFNIEHESLKNRTPSYFIKNLNPKESREDFLKKYDRLTS